MCAINSAHFFIEQSYEYNPFTTIILGKITSCYETFSKIVFGHHINYKERNHKSSKGH